MAWTPLDEARAASDSVAAHVADHNQVHAWANAASTVDVGIRYVATSGDDANDGLSWATAVATPQHGYDLLVTKYGTAFSSVESVGELRVGPGSYVGPTLDSARTVNIIGVGNVSYGAPVPTDGMTIFHAASAASTEIMYIGEGVGTNIGRRNVIRNIVFDLDTTPAALTAGIRGYNLTGNVVEDCLFYSTAHMAACWAMEYEGFNDNSWQRINNNTVRGLGLLKTVFDGNQNRWAIRDNVCFWYPDSATDKAMMDLTGLDASIIEGNNLEGRAIGVWLRSCFSNTLSGNAGEGVETGVEGHANPFYRVGVAAGTSSSSNTFIGGDCRFTGSAVTTGIWIEIAKGSQNMVQQANLVAAATTSTRKAHWTNPGGSPNIIVGGAYTDWTTI